MQLDRGRIFAGLEIERQIAGAPGRDACRSAAAPMPATTNTTTSHRSLPILFPTISRYNFFMKTATLALFCAAGALAFGQSVPEIPFDSNPDFFKLPADLHFGETAGVAVNSQGQVYVFSRGNTTGPAYGATAAQVLRVRQRTASIMREIGHNLYAWSFAHTVRVDRQDNLWAVDKGSDMIIKFNPQGRVMMVFGRKTEASDENAEPLEHSESAAPRAGRPVPPAHRRHLGPAKATSSSATATSTRASPSSTRMATG